MRHPEPEITIVARAGIVRTHLTMIEAHARITTIIITVTATPVAAAAAAAAALILIPERELWQNLASVLPLLLAPWPLLVTNLKMSDEAVLAIEVGPDTTVHLLSGLEGLPMAKSAASRNAESIWRALAWLALRWLVSWRRHAVAPALVSVDRDLIAGSGKPSLS